MSRSKEKNQDYRDVPEFFTYLSGDCDGQHWGMLLDEPTDGFRGVAMY